MQDKKCKVFYPRYHMVGNNLALSLGRRRIRVLERVEQQHGIVLVGESFLDLVAQFYARDLVGTEGQKLKGRNGNHEPIGI